MEMDWVTITTPQWSLFVATSKIFAGLSVKLRDTGKMVLPAQQKSSKGGGA